MRALLLILLCILPVWAAGPKFSTTSQEAHLGPEDLTTTLDFPFTNDGKGIIVFRKFDSPCACLSVELVKGKLHYNPGEKGIVRATFRVASLSGTINKPIIGWMAGDPKNKPSIKLHAQVHVPKIVELKPNSLHWAIGEDPTPKSIHIKIHSDDPVKLTKVEMSSDQFSHVIKTIKEGAEYKIEVSPKNTENRTFGVVRIETDSPIPRNKTKQVILAISKKRILPNPE